MAKIGKIRESARHKWDKEMEIENLREELDKEYYDPDKEKLEGALDKLKEYKKLKSSLKIFSGKKDGNRNLPDKGVPT